MDQSCSNSSIGSLSSLSPSQIELTAEELAALNNADLLQLIQILETHEIGATPREYDHRKYLERPELERIFFLLRWLRRTRRQTMETPVQYSPSTTTSPPVAV